MTALVEQGILPSPKTSPALFEQRQRLERAKMGDMLKAKIAQRPDRQELVHRHILEDVWAMVDPSLYERQRQLKRAKLADSLSSQLSHRPGPLELIQKNILHPQGSEEVERAVKDGLVAFKPTSEGVAKHFENSSMEDDTNESVHSLSKSESGDWLSQLSESSNSSPLAPSAPTPLSDQGVVKSGSSDSVLPSILLHDRQQQQQQLQQPMERRGSDLSLLAAQAPSVVQVQLAKQKLDAAGFVLSSSSPTLVAAANLPSACVGQVPLALSSSSLQQSHLAGQGNYSQRSAPGKDQVRKKKIIKARASAASSQKSRTIKFHEYKVKISPGCPRKVKNHAVFCIGTWKCAKKTKRGFEEISR